MDSVCAAAAYIANLALEGVKVPFRIIGWFGGKVVSVVSTAYNKLIGNPELQAGNQVPSTVITERRASSLEPGRRAELSQSVFIQCGAKLEVAFIQTESALKSMEHLYGHDLSIYKQHVDEIKGKASFSDEDIPILKEVAEELNIDESLINDMKNMDINAIIQFLEGRLTQVEETDRQRQEGVQSAIENLNTLKANFDAFNNNVELVRPYSQMSGLLEALTTLIRGPGPVPENKVDEMRKHVEALATFIDTLKNGPIGCLTDGSEPEHPIVAKSVMSAFSKVTNDIGLMRNMLGGNVSVRASETNTGDVTSNGNHPINTKVIPQ